jgi:hypothetical protein
MIAAADESLKKVVYDITVRFASHLKLLHIGKSGDAWTRRTRKRHRGTGFVTSAPPVARKPLSVEQLSRKQALSRSKLAK